MKKFICLLLAAVLLCSCAAETLPEETAAETVVRNYVDIRRKETWYDLECIATDYSLIENIIPESTQILMLRVDSVKEVLYTGSYHFEYGCEILKIYHDDSASLKVGDSISVFTTEGSMKASDAAALIRYPLTYHGKKTLTESYTDSDYISSSHFNAVPIEIGGTYIVYLSSDSLERYGYYNEIGYSYLYEAVGENIYTSSERVLSEKKLEDVEKEIDNQLKMYSPDKTE
ncbi:MAG: hypothetical protein IJX93_07455 [Clostridia bacterium]|nr:hypothetical protein [Clostridia bacterium]